MATFMVLARYTHQGVEHVKASARTARGGQEGFPHQGRGGEGLLYLDG